MMGYNRSTSILALIAIESEIAQYKEMLGHLARYFEEKGMKNFHESVTNSKVALEVALENINSVVES